MPIKKKGRYMVKRVFATSILLFSLLGLPLTLCGAEQEYHVIQTGETLYSIAKNYSIPYEMLANSNGITDPSKIRPGIVLLIPQIHVVAKGETYYGISKKYSIEISELKSANHLSDSYVLRVGDVLLIPEAGTTSPQMAQLNASPANVNSTSPSSSLTKSESSSTSATSTTTAPGAVSPVTTVPAQNISPASDTTSAKNNASTGTATAPQKEASGPSAIASKTSTPTLPQPTPSVSTPSSKGEPTASRSPDTLVSWPVDGKAQYMSGKLEGVMFQTSRGTMVKAVASGTVVSAGPSRGFGEVVFVQSKAGFVYVYGGNESILVKTGESIAPGKTIAKVGLDTKEGAPVAYFFVFRNGQPVDPSVAPRE